MIDYCSFIAVLLPNIACCLCTTILCYKNNFFCNLFSEQCCDNCFLCMLPISHAYLISEEPDINDNNNNYLPKYGEEVISIDDKNIVEDIPPPEYKEN